MKLFVGVDGGGSKSRAAVVDVDLRVLGRGDGGPSNISSRPIGSVCDAIGAAVDGALREAGAARGDILQFGFGLAGAESTDAREKITKGLAQYFNIPRITLATDARAALAGAMRDADDPGMILIAGTGSVAYGRNRSGGEARAGGLGWLVGDEGSGFSIARRALECAARAFDGRGPRTQLLDTLAVRHGIASLDQLIQFVYRPEELPSNIAAVLPAVLEAARRGDALAANLFADAANELAELVISVITKLEMQNELFTIATLGGLWSAGELLNIPVARRVALAAPAAAFASPCHPPEVGAARLAMADYLKSAKR
ncbi:MAG: hypothetical protein HY286_08630 [Planctomycetes bacterium]|nr:hypothetical protein [Planctomycetota bacterium]